MCEYLTTSRREARLLLVTARMQVSEDFEVFLCEVFEVLFVKIYPLLKREASSLWSRREGW